MEEERNKIPEQVRIRKIGVENRIDMEERDKILEILKTPWVGDGWRLEYMMTVIRHNGGVIKFASEDPWGDRDIVIVAVKHYGWPLVFISEEIRRDRGIVMAAVTQYREALEFASENIQRDRDIVKAAVRHNGGALKFV